MSHGELFRAASDEELPLFEGPDDSPLEMLRQYVVFSGLLGPLQQNIQEINLSAAAPGGFILKLERWWSWGASRWKPGWSALYGSMIGPAGN